MILFLVAFEFCNIRGFYASSKPEV